MSFALLDRAAAVPAPPPPGAASTTSRALVGAWFAGMFLLDLGARYADAGGEGPARLAATSTALAALWTAALLLAVRLAARYPVGPGRPRSHLLPHAAALAAVTGADFGLNLAAGAVLGVPVEAQLLLFRLAIAAQYALLTAGVHGWEYARRSRGALLSEARLRAELASAELSRTRAELRALKMELNPHFLFNSLHGVCVLAPDDPAAARRLLASLGDLLRETLGADPDYRVPLRRELEALRPFLDVEHTRLGGRLLVRWEVDDAALDVPVPHLILQPLAENAVKHGVGGDGGTVTIRAAAGAGTLTLEVCDAGHGGRPAPRPGTGLGLANVRDRLGEWHPGATLALHPQPGGGTVARIRVPLAEEPPPPAPRGAAPPPAAAVKGPRAIPRGGVALAMAWWAMGTALGYGTWSRLPVPRGGTLPPVGALLAGAYSAAVTTAMLLAVVRLVLRSAGAPHPEGRAPLGNAARSAARIGAIATAAWAAQVAVPLVLGYATLPTAAAEAPGRILALFFLCAIGAAAAHGWEAARRFRQKEVDELRLQAHVAGAGLARAQAELRALKMELNPSFLLQTLHSVGDLLEEDAPTATRMLTRLSELLRETLVRARVHEVPLETEMELLRPFVDIEGARRGAPLEVEWDVTDDAADALVPHLILQPLLEAALRGAAEGGGPRVRIRAWCPDDGVRIEVAREEPGARPGGDARDVTAIANVRARLRELYGEAARLDVSDRAGAPFQASVALPAPGFAWAPPPARLEPRAGSLA